MKDQGDKQTVDVFQGEKKARGGYRPGAGRPKKGVETVVVRIPASMAESVSIMAAAVRAGHIVEYRIIPVSKIEAD